MERDSAGAVLNGGQPPAPAPTETDRIRAVYQRYDIQERWLRKRDLANPGLSELQAERWRKIAGIIGARLREVSPLLVVDVGCGRGSDLAHIAELRPDAGLFEAVPDATLWVRDGATLPFPDRSVQLVMLSTILSSILDPATRRQVTAEAYRIIADDGIRPHSVTLLAPVTRILCRRWPGLYRPLASVRPLRSHYLPVVTGP